MRERIGRDQRTGLRAEDLGDRRLGSVAALLDGLEDGGVLELEADPESEADQHRGEQERHAPAPGLELLLGEGEREAGESAVGHEVAGGRADLGGRGPESAAPRIAVFAGQQDGAAPFAADGDTLGEAQQHQDDRRGDADAGVAGQESDEERRDADEQQRDHQQLFASDDVAESAEHEPTDRACDVADGVGGEREQGSRERVGLGEEDDREDQRGGGRVDREVVPLEGRAGQAGRESLGQGLAVGPPCLPSVVRGGVHGVPFGVS